MKASNTATQQLALPASRTSQHQTTAYLGISLIRLHITGLMQSPVFTDVERLRANDSIYQCEDIARLLTWQRNVARVLQERELSATPFIDAAPQQVSESATPMWVEPVAASESTAYVQQALISRAHRGRTSDYAAELDARRQEENFIEQTGLSWADVAHL